MCASIPAVRVSDTWTLASHLCCHGSAEIYKSIANFKLDHLEFSNDSYEKLKPEMPNVLSLLLYFTQLA